MDEQNVNIRSNMANFHIYIRGQISITWYVQPIYFSIYTKLSLSLTNLYIKTLFGHFVLLQDHILSVIYGSYFKWALHMPKVVILRMDQRSKCHTRSRPRICSFLLTMGRRYILYVTYMMLECTINFSNCMTNSHNIYRCKQVFLNFEQSLKIVRRTIWKSKTTEDGEQHGTPNWLTLIGTELWFESKRLNVLVRQSYSPIRSLFLNLCTTFGDVFHKIFLVTSNWNFWSYSSENRLFYHEIVLFRLSLTQNRINSAARE